MIKIASVDIGLDGGIAIDGVAVAMPTREVLDKPEVRVYNLKNGKKQYYKTGDRKGEVITKVRTSAKTHRELRLEDVRCLFLDATIVVIEAPGNSMGNSAKSSSTTDRNYGKLLAVAELCACEIVTVAPHKWKKDLGLSKDKLDSVERAEKLFPGQVFRTDRGRLIDGNAEAALLYHWYVNFKDK